MVGHNDMLASADKIVGETFGTFVVVDDDFIDVGESVDFLLRFGVESVAAISNGVLINYRDGEVDIVPETVGMIREWVNMFGAIVV